MSRTGALLGLALIVGGALALRLELFVGFIGSDDAGAWYRAHRIAETGRLEPGDILVNRIASVRYGPILPGALAIRLFGEGERTIALYPLVMSLLGVVAAWDLARRLTGNVFAAHLAGAVVALCSMDVHAATVFLPDGPMAAVSLLALDAVVAASEGGRGRSALFFVAGLLAAFAVMHKEVGLQLAAALALWGLSLLATRRLERRHLLILAGFAVGVAAEHAMFWASTGDPFFRWRAVGEAEALNRQTREAALGGAPSVIAKLGAWWTNLWDEQPSFSLVVLGGIGLGLVAAARGFRDLNVRLVALYAMVLSVARVAELRSTFSYQPRRLLPFAGCAAVLLAVAASRWIRPRLAAILLGVAFLGAEGALLARTDAVFLRKEGAKLGVERRLHDWTRKHEDLIRSYGLWTDARTHRVVTALSGFADLSERGVRLLGSAEPPDGAFLFENPRVLEWLLGGGRDDPALAFWRALPRGARLQAVVVHPRGSAWNAALYRIHAGATGDGGGEAGHAIPIGPGGGAVVEGSALAPLVRKGAALVLRVPVRARAGELDGPPWPRVRLRVDGLDERGRRRKLIAKEGVVRYPEQELRAYAVAERDERRLRVAVTVLPGGGGEGEGEDAPLEVGPIELRAYDVLPYQESPM